MFKTLVDAGHLFFALPFCVASQEQIVPGIVAEWRLIEGGIIAVGHIGADEGHRGFHILLVHTVGHALQGVVSLKPSARSRSRCSNS